jgi:SAM-dependent methyltransferase
MEEAVNYQRFLTGLISKLVSSAGSGASLLDFGAGVGTYARQAQALGPSVLCVEIDDGLAARLAGQGFEVVAGLDAVAPQSQQALYSFNVLEHIDDDQAALHDLFRVAAPGGHLLLYVPAFPVLFGAVDRRVGHVRRYRRRQLIARVRAAGFEVDSSVYADSLGFPAALAYRALGHRASGELSARSVGRYDRLLFPLSRRLDSAWLQHCFGKNLVLTAHRPQTE